MRILVLGAQGMLARELLPRLRQAVGNEVYGRDVEDFDITDRGRVKEEILNLRPRVVINCAAFTDVDACESRQETAMAVNAEGARNVALACAAAGSTLLHISTDYIFDGSSPGAYREEDPPGPLNVYGLSKLKGEEFIREIWADHLILRTAWLYGPGGRNFVDTVLRLAEEGPELRVVDDQRGSPTFTRDLSWAVDQLLKKSVRGTVHVTNSGVCTWFAFARRILEMKKNAGIRVIPVSSGEIARPARRPANSVLDCTRFEELSGRTMRPWPEALREYLSRWKTMDEG